MGGFLLARVTDTDNPLDPTFPSPLEVWVVSYELISKWGSQDKEEFPSPLEVWVVSYTWNWVKKHPWAVVVSVPSRGMGGFLQSICGLCLERNVEFPSPLEVWVVSYFIMERFNRFLLNSFRPLSRYGWFPTKSRWIIADFADQVSVPSRGMGGFLRHQDTSLNLR